MKERATWNLLCLIMCVHSRISPSLPSSPSAHECSSQYMQPILHSSPILAVISGNFVTTTYYSDLVQVVCHAKGGSENSRLAILTQHTVSRRSTASRKGTRTRHKDSEEELNSRPIGASLETPMKLISRSTATRGRSPCTTDALYN